MNLKYLHHHDSKAKNSNLHINCRRIAVTCVLVPCNYKNLGVSCFTIKTNASAVGDGADKNVNGSLSGAFVARS